MDIMIDQKRFRLSRADFGPRVFSQVSQLALQHFAADAMTLPKAAVLCTVTEVKAGHKLKMAENG